METFAKPLFEIGLGLAPLFLVSLSHFDPRDQFPSIAWGATRKSRRLNALETILLGTKGHIPAAVFALPTRMETLHGIAEEVTSD